MGFIFLLKWEQAKASDPSSANGESDFDADLFFAKQEITNACATQAILHILLNSDETIIQLGDILSNFQSFTKDLPADMRGLCLSNSLEIRQAHNEFGNLEEYLAFGEEDGDKEDKSKSQDPFHFVAFVCKNSSIYELDGLKDAPIKHEKCSDSWPEQVLQIVENRIKEKEDVRFNLMAVVEDPRQYLLNKISDLNSQIESNREGSGDLKGRRFQLQQQLDDEEAKWIRYRKDWDTRKKEMAKVYVQPKTTAFSAQVQNLLKSLESKGLFKNQ